MKEQDSTATTNTYPLFMAPFTPEELKHELEIKQQLPDKSPGPSYITKLVALISKDLFSSFSTVYGNSTHNPQAGNFLSSNPSTKDTIRTK